MHQKQQTKDGTKESYRGRYAKKDRDINVVKNQHVLFALQSQVCTSSCKGSVPFLIAVRARKDTLRLRIASLIMSALD